MDFEKITRRSWLSWAAIVVLAGLCGVLAVLQYRWIGDVADAERQRLREDLQTRLNLFRQDLDNQITNICYSYIPSAAEIQKLGVEKAYLAKIRQNKDSGNEIVGRVALVVPAKLGVVLLFPDNTGAR